MLKLVFYTPRLACPAVSLNELHTKEACMQGCINRARIGKDLSSERSLPSFPHLGNVGMTRKIMESTAELIFCGS